MLSYSVSYTGVFLAAIVGFILAFIWWGPLFGMKWAKMMGYSEKDMKKAKEKGMAQPMIVMFIADLIMAFVLSVLMMSTGMTAMSAALTLGFWVWLGFIATVGIGIVLWDNKPMNLFWLNSFGWLVAILGMSATLTMF